MRLQRTAQRAARAVYGSIIALAVMLVLDEAGGEADEVLAAVSGSVIAAALAESYAEYIAAAIRERRHPDFDELRESFADAAAGMLAALAPLIPFLLVEVDVIELPTAYDVGIWLGLGVIVSYTLLANRLAGFSALRNVTVTAAALVIGLSLIAIKTFTH